MNIPSYLKRYRQLSVGLGFVRVCNPVLWLLYVVRNDSRNDMPRYRAARPTVR